MSVDECLDLVLKASGSGLKNYSTHKTLESMRAAMRNIQGDAYCQGWSDCTAEFKSQLTKVKNNG